MRPSNYAIRLLVSIKGIFLSLLIAINGRLIGLSLV
nr:MAG TPA: hypothetical protein [Caudoviricetes sp.]